MNYLQLVQRLGREVGASGSIATVTGATGEFKRLADWVAQAWLELQMERREWNWMRKSTTFPTVIGQQAYDPVTIPIADLDHWVNGTFRIYQTTADNEQFLSQLEYDIFRDTYIIGTSRTTQGFPSAVTIDPNKKILLALIPNAVYTVVADYYKVPTELDSDDDVPDIPSRFHMLPVYKAMEWYASYENAPEVIARGAQNYRNMYDQLLLDQMPMIGIDRGFL